jgi:hypothetical protein
MSSQKVRNQVSVMFAVLTFRDSFKNNKVLVSFLVEVKQSCLIVHSVTIVWC